MKENKGHFKKGQGGRPKGARNKKTTEAAKLVASALAATSQPEQSMSERQDTPSAEIPGIASKVALTNIMRRSWDEYIQKQEQLDPFEAKIDALQAELVAIFIKPPGQTVTQAELAKADVLADAIKALNDHVLPLRSAVNAARSLVTQHAIALLPYEYPRLQANTNKQVGDIIVKIKSFGAEPRKGPWKKSQ